MTPESSKNMLALSSVCHADTEDPNIGTHNTQIIGMMIVDRFE